MRKKTNLTLGEWVQPLLKITTTKIVISSKKVVNLHHARIKLSIEDDVSIISVNQRSSRQATNHQANKTTKSTQLAPIQQFKIINSFSEYLSPSQQLYRRGMLSQDPE